jgi:hypothetical protein
VVVSPWRQGCLNAFSLFPFDGRESWARMWMEVVKSGQK